MGSPSSTVIEDVNRAVESAVSEGVTPKDFVDLAAELWDHALYEQKKYHVWEWNKIHKATP